MIALDTHVLAQDQDFGAPITVMLELVGVLEVNDCALDEMAADLK